MLLFFPPPAGEEDWIHAVLKWAITVWELMQEMFQLHKALGKQRFSSAESRACGLLVVSYLSEIINIIKASAYPAQSLQSAWWNCDCRDPDQLFCCLNKCERAHKHWAHCHMRSQFVGTPACCLYLSAQISSYFLFSSAEDIEGFVCCSHCLVLHEQKPTVSSQM